MRQKKPEDKFFRLFQHSVVQSILAGEYLGHMLQNQMAPKELTRALPEAVIVEAGRALSQSAKLPKLRSWLCELMKRWPACQPMAASILYAATDGDWKPGRGIRKLSYAFLADATLPEAVFPDTNVLGCKLARANLTGANLERVKAHDATFSRAVLAHAQLTGMKASRADFTGADLSGATARNARLVAATLRNAYLRNGKFRGINLRGADLCNAHFCDADLREAELLHAEIEGADFTGADLRDALLTGLVLLMTGSVLPGADLRGALLQSAGLADVRWEGADLRDADFTACSFHLGSSRSGLVDSPIACEGSKTGFYTDDYEDLHFRRPSQIRKADLRQADLRGARVSEADFYLVDLRGALFDDDQRAHFRRCGAILDT